MSWLSGIIILLFGFWCFKTGVHVAHPGSSGTPYIAENGLKPPILFFHFPSVGIRSLCLGFLFCFVYLTHLRVTLEKEPQLRKASIRLACRQVCRAFLNHWWFGEGPDSSLCVMLSLGRWSWWYQKAGWVMVDKLVGSITPWSLL